MYKLLTIKEVAEMVGVSTSTITRWEDKGKIKKSKRDEKGRKIFDINDVEKLRAFRIVTSFL